MALIQHANLKPWAAITGPRRAILHPDLEHRNDEDTQTSDGCSPSPCTPPTRMGT